MCTSGLFNVWNLYRKDMGFCSMSLRPSYQPVGMWVFLSFRNTYGSLAVLEDGSFQLQTNKTKQNIGLHLAVRGDAEEQDFRSPC